MSGCAIRRLILLLASISVSTVIMMPTRILAAPPAAAAEPEVLNAKGLKKTGTQFLLAADEKEVSDGMRTLAQLKAKFDKDAKERAGYEQNVQRAKTAMAEWDFERRSLNEKLAVVKDPTQNNHLIAEINIRTSKIAEGKTFQDENEAKIRGLGDDTREQYINQVQDLSKKADDVAAKYKELSASDEIKNALNSVHGKLGPSAEFTSAASRLKLMRSGFKSDVVRIKNDGNVPMVEVTLNGKTTRSFVLDSGASMVCLPAELAKTLEMVPGPKDPLIHVQLADGKVVEAHQMILKSVRVGNFTVDNVECGVMPPELVSVEPLLGGTFLKNFIYKMDPNAGELHLARIGGNDKDKKK